MTISVGKGYKTFSNPICTGKWVVNGSDDDDE